MGEPGSFALTSWFPIFLKAMNGVLGKVVDKLGSSVMIFQWFRSVFLILLVEREYVVRNTRGRGCLGVEGFGVGPVEVVVEVFSMYQTSTPNVLFIKG